MQNMNNELYGTIGTEATEITYTFRSKETERIIVQGQKEAAEIILDLLDRGAELSWKSVPAQQPQ